MTLRLDWASHKAAELACRRWHYSGGLPTGKLVKVGVWEDDRFVGVIIYSRGASPYLGRAYELGPTEVCELTRIALRDHVAPVSQMIAISLRFLRRSNPGLRLVVSFADPARGHHGGVYQAAGWIYTGQSMDVDEYMVGGRWRHKKGVWYDLRAAGRQGRNLPVVEGGRPVEWRIAPGKHRYLWPLDRATRALIEPLALPYPPALDSAALRAGSIEGDAAADQAD